MTKVKLTDGTIINASTVEVVKGVLKISTTEKTVEELAAIFSDKSKTNHIVLLTESEKESGFKTGFTSFAGITYDVEGTKTIELFQPVDATEARISNAEGKANEAINTANSANTATHTLEEQNAVLASTVDAILTDIIPSLAVMAEEPTATE